jgi:hypothetical protein
MERGIGREARSDAPAMAAKRRRVAVLPTLSSAWHRTVAA